MPEHQTRAEHLQWAKDRALAYLQPPQHPQLRDVYTTRKGHDPRARLGHHSAGAAPISAAQLRDAWASFVSDLGKHPETAGHMAIQLGMLEQMTGGLNTADKLRRFIEGAN